MSNLKSGWNFSATSLDLAAKDDKFALRICAVDLKNFPTGVQRPTRSPQHLFDLGESGGIPSKGAYPQRTKVAKLPQCRKRHAIFYPNNPNNPRKSG